LPTPLRRTPVYDFTDIEDWFWSQTAEDGDHLIWTGKLETKRYPVVHRFGRTFRAHHIAWQLNDRNLWLPAGRDLLRRCDHPQCILLAHYTLNSPMSRFWELVQSGEHPEGFETRCRNWSGRLNDGYGQFHVDKDVVLAHRWIYEQLIGPIPDGMQIDHLCGNPRCVNVEHLVAVTRADHDERHRALRRERDAGIATSVSPPLYPFVTP
jgi:hypothetical protein